MYAAHTIQEISFLDGVLECSCGQRWRPFEYSQHVAMSIVEDLSERCATAAGDLTAQVGPVDISGGNAGDVIDAMRLMAKSEGVLLAMSYVKEVLR